MKQHKPVFGSLGSNYTFLTATRALWWQLFPPSEISIQTELSLELIQLFPGFTEPYFFATGRDAIQCTLRNLPLPIGAQVLTQAFSCAAIEEAILDAELQPVFVDLAEESVNVSVTTLQATYAKYPEARVVLVQHLFGYPADIAAIRTWCDEHNLLLIEDLAQAFGGTTQSGERLGSFGHAIVTSFGRDKVIDAVAGGCCLFRQGLLSSEPVRQSLRSRSSWQQALYPLFTVVIRATFSFWFGKLLHRVARQLGILTNPVLRSTRPLEKLSVGQATLVLQQLKQLSAELEYRSLITSIYARFLQSYVLTTESLARPNSLLRFPIVVSDPDALATALKKSNFYLTDRWYRAAVDSGSVPWESTYQPQSCLRAEERARTIFTLPTHRQISPQIAVALATVIRTVLDTKSAYAVKKIDDQQTWEVWLDKRPEANFLQSWSWGEFQESIGNEITRLGLYRDGVLIGVALGIYERARRGTYCSLPGGPLLDWDDPVAARMLFSHLQTEAKTKRCIFIRFRPQLVEDAIAQIIVQNLGSVRSAMHVTADRTVELDITDSDEELLAGMRKNTRSAIRKSQKLGIRTEVSRDPNTIKEFYEQQRLVAERHKFVPFSYQFLFEQFKTFAQHDQAILVSAYQGEQLLATAFVLLYHRQAVYHYGISTAENGKLPGAYAVQWRVIAEAKAHGCTSYNLWGVAPPGMSAHRFVGVSLFKRGFGGQEIQYLEAHDIPLTPLYWGTRLFELQRKWRRHL